MHRIAVACANQPPCVARRYMSTKCYAARKSRRQNARCQTRFSLLSTPGYSPYVRTRPVRAERRGEPFRGVEGKNENVGGSIDRGSCRGSRYAGIRHAGVERREFSGKQAPAGRSEGRVMKMPGKQQYCTRAEMEFVYSRSEESLAMVRYARLPRWSPRPAFPGFFSRPPRHACAGIAPTGRRRSRRRRRRHTACGCQSRNARHATWIDSFQSFVPPVQPRKSRDGRRAAGDERQPHSTRRRCYVEKNHASLSW
jgi:hypothetical protein